MMSVEQLYEEILRLTPTDRLRLVERVVHDVVERRSGDAEPATIIGMMADEPEVMDEVTRLATTARHASRMRPTDG
ncbi:MAG: hypothetical protein L6Q84_33735 [Polyangiaceae bacterium]|nr:hypothetical protein [Polyangiaceae bacterium]